MASRGDHKEDNELSDYLHRLGYEVGSLRFHMRNSDYLMSELLMTQTAIKESKALETLPSHSEDHKPENLEREYIHRSLSDRILTDSINCSKDPLNPTSLCSEHLEDLCEIEAELLRKVDEMCQRYEETFSQIIHSSKL